MGPTDPAVCKPCGSNPAVLNTRIGPSCEACYVNRSAGRAIKRMGGILKDVRTAAGSAKGFMPTYLIGLSFGVSSAALLHILRENVLRLNKSKATAFNSFKLRAVHIDTDLASTTMPSPAEELAQKYTERFPEVTFDVVHLSEALGLDSIDWSALPRASADLDSRARLLQLLQGLPSTTARADVIRLFTRHLLLKHASGTESHALLLGSSTTALAELILGETAKGRGHTISWQVGDGPFPLARFQPTQDTVAETSTKLDDLSLTKDSGQPTTLLVYHPMRELLRNEATLYVKTAQVDMAHLIVDASSSSSASVVSHRDLSIEDVMGRYFEEVEKSYPAVVTNVVRTTGKLTKPDGELCGACGITLDQEGDTRWKGELGEDPTAEAAGESRLCYGCQRSIRG